MMPIDGSLHTKISVVRKRHLKTEITVTPMDTSVPRDMIVHIVCGHRRGTRRTPQRRISWEVVYYTKNYHTVLTVNDGVGREKRVATSVSFKKY